MSGSPLFQRRQSFECVQSKARLDRTWIELYGLVPHRAMQAQQREIDLDIQAGDADKWGVALSKRRLTTEALLRKRGCLSLPSSVPMLCYSCNGLLTLFVVLILPPGPAKLPLVQRRLANFRGLPLAGICRNCDLRPTVVLLCGSYLALERLVPV